MKDRTDHDESYLNIFQWKKKQVESIYKVKLEKYKLYIINLFIACWYV